MLAGLLKIGELGNLHAVQPYFPAQPRGTQGRRLPVVFHKPDIMFQRIKAQSA